ncbi:MAG TPA: GNAT family N-acetyltransferase [Candidatus Dormibacteraeota bacterium]|nr:GNAT family N-acetyltransferase [Candidatus Dormibacteraeota bacterium]
MSVQLDALAAEVFEAAAALDLFVPPELRAVAALDPCLDGSGATQRRVAMVQVFTEIPLRAGAPPAPDFTLVPVRDDSAWMTFADLIRLDVAEAGGTDDMVAGLISLNRWRASNTPPGFYLAYQGDRAVAHVGLFQHRTSAYLHSLFVEPSVRGRGAGSFLTRAVNAEARSIGCERVVLQCTRESRLPAYFKRLGFRAVGEQQV